MGHFWNKFWWIENQLQNLHIFFVAPIQLKENLEFFRVLTRIFLGLMREDAYYKDESRLRSGGYMSRGGANCVGQMRGRNLSGEIRTIKDALEDFRIQKQSQISTVPSFDNESFPALERFVF